MAWGRATNATSVFTYCNRLINWAPNKLGHRLWGKTMSNNESIVAFGLLTQNDLDRLGSSFVRAYPVAETPCFGGLLAELDDADRLVWRNRDRDARYL